MVGSSTPDGLAPVSQQGIVIFSAVLSVVPLLWALTNLALLLRPPQHEPQHN